MNNPWRALVAVLAIAGFGCATRVIAENHGSPVPQIEPYPVEVTNGDFLIIGACGPPECPNSPENSKVGDGVNEWTRWTFDFSKAPRFTEFAADCKVRAAILTLEFTPRHSGYKNPNDTPNDSLILHKNNQKTGHLGSDQIVSATLNRTCRIDIDALSPSLDLWGLIMKAPAGVIEAEYQDDATISYARLEIECSDGLRRFRRLTRRCS